MAKVHITLVGGQAAPVYYGIIEDKPDIVYLVCSSITRNETNHITKATKEKLPLVTIFVREFDANNLQNIANSIATLKQELNSSDEITLNLVGGTKAWSLMFYEAFSKESNVSISLVEQSGAVWDLKTHQRHETEIEFYINTQFILQGNPLNDYFPFSNYTSKDGEVIKEIERARNFAPKAFTNLTATISKEQEHELRTEDEGCFSYFDSYVEWIGESFVRLVLARKRNGELVNEEFVIESPNAKRLVFGSNWFEYKVARMLSIWKFAKEIRCNCLFPVKTINNNQIKNEVDIVVNTGNKLLFVECKTQINKSVDIDKFRTVVRNYGGLSSKGIVITDADMSEIHKEKCMESGLLFFSFKKPNANPDRQQALLSYLTQEIATVNKR